MSRSPWTLAWRRRAITLLLGSMLPMTVAASPVLHGLLERPVVQPGERYGAALVADEVTVLIAAPGRDLAVPGLPTTDAGAIEVFVGNSQGWSHLQTLLSPVPQTGRALGTAIALTGNLAAAASLYRFDLFERSGPGLAFAHVVSESFTPLGGIRPFASVAIAGDWLAFAYGSSTGAGRVRVYRRIAGIWQIQAVLFAEAPAGNDEFGIALAISGDHLLVGAPREDRPGVANAGVVYVFQLGAGLPALIQRFAGFVTQAQAQFGQAIAIHGDQVVVGAPREDLTVAAPDAGAAYLYTRQPEGIWLFQQRFVAPDFRTEAFYGTAVAIHGESVAIGAPGHDVPVGPMLYPRAGRTYAYRRNGGSWWLDGALTLPPADLDVDDGFGSAVALGKDWLLVGAEADEAGGVIDAGQGRAYVRPIFRDGFDLL